MNNYNPDIHHRHSFRLQGYDYSQEGLYFVTICTHEHKYLFGEIKNDHMTLNNIGEIIKQTWFDLPNHIPNIILDAFCIMPNHIHGIIEITSPNVGAGSKPAQLSEIIRQFKTFSARKINIIRKIPGTPVWQRNYYEHIIRNNHAYDNIYSYILNNPKKWNEDKMFGK
ncbi:transposase [uncultured Parabacteroides sp.]|uniref:transposase n=1 Tax=uncultured Parabacteroides sp. TaxID=512312 RepID=UPI0025E96DDF|nr:transposase [uncultured Parabacteroides sp.]